MRVVKSKTCFSHDGKPLTEYICERAAQDAADYINSKTLDADFEVYQCPKCSKFHIRAQGCFVNMRAKTCSCTDSNKKPKNSYQTPADALKVAKLAAEKGVCLFVYRCPKGNGWHLTKQKPKKNRSTKTTFVIPKHKNEPRGNDKPIKKD